MLDQWLEFDAGDNVIWEAHEKMREDLPGVLEAFLHTAGDRNMKKEIIDLYL